jgi:hypothetical protein
MAPRARRVLLTVLVAALVSGCGGVAPAPPTPTAPPPTPTGTPEERALAWTESVCAAVVPVVARLAAAPAVRFDAPEATRQEYLTYLADGIATTDRARAALAAAGPAPVTDGDALAEQVRGNVADLRADLVDARAQVERTDPGSAAALARVLVGGSNLVGALLEGAQVAGTINRDPALREAYGRAPSCARLRGSGATAPTAPPTR